jgi:hypothetical protein
MTFIKNSSTVLLASIIVNFSIVAMENSEQRTPLIYHGMIAEIHAPTIQDLFAENSFNKPIVYAPQSVHQYFHLSSSVYDPLIMLQITDESSQVKFKKIIPLKNCYNLDDKSVLMTLKRSGSQLYPNDLNLRNKQYLVKVLCTKNPNLPGKSFSEQLNDAATSFYEITAHWSPQEFGDPIPNLIDNKVLAEYLKIELRMSLGTETLISKQFELYEHGPNGCSSKEKLEQSIINEEIKFQNISRFLQNREMGNLKQQKISHQENLDWIIEDSLKHIKFNHTT